MPGPATVETLLAQWALWFRVEAFVGPGHVDCGSAASAYCSPQCWERDHRVLRTSGEGLDDELDDAIGNRLCR